MRVAIVDTETSGLSKDDKLVEFALVMLENGKVIETHESLVNPGIEIPPEASAVHHLTNDDVANAMPHEMAQKFITEWLYEADVVAAHNLAFDVKFLPELKGKQKVCTFRTAKHLVEAPSYSNQALRYRLKLKPELPTHLAPHRALYDSLVTAELFNHLVGIAGSIQTLIDLTAKPVIAQKISFGKHAGQAFKDLPLSYLHWLANLEGKDDDFIATVRYWIGIKSQSR